MEGRCFLRHIKAVKMSQLLHTHRVPAMLPSCLTQGGSAVSLLLRPNKTGCKAEFIALSGIFSFGSNPHQYICNISNALAKMGLFWRPDMFIALANHPFLFNLVLDRNKYMHWDLHMSRQANIFRLACWGLHLYCNHCCSYRWCQAPCWQSPAASNIATVVQGSPQAKAICKSGEKLTYTIDLQVTAMV